MIKSFILCSDATHDNEKGTGDPTEIALIVLGEKYGLKKDALNKAHPRISEVPFDSERKLMSTLNIEGKGYRVHTKGAIDNLLEICTQVLINGQVVPLTFEMKQKYLAVTEKMSQQALRVLATAYKDTETLSNHVKWKRI